MGDLQKELFKISQDREAGRRKWRWVSRDLHDEYISIWPGEEKPTQNKRGHYFQGDDPPACVIHRDDLWSLIGIELAEGRCVRFEFKGRICGN